MHHSVKRPIDSRLTAVSMNDENQDLHTASGHIFLPVAKTRLLLVLQGDALCAMAQ